MNRRYGLISLAAALLLALFIWNCNDLRLHREIRLEDVAKVELKAKGIQDRVPATEQEKEQIVRWFNAAGGIRDNSHHGSPGCGDFNYVHITLTSGERIDISSYGRVTRYRDPKDQNYIDYYFSQPELDLFLDTLDKRLQSKGSGGC